MRSRTLGFLGAIACLCAMSTVVAAAPAQADSKSGVGARATSEPTLTAVSEAEALSDLFSPLPDNVPVYRYRAVAGDTAGGIAAGMADEGVDECVQPCTLVYENTLGRALFGPTSAIGRRLADDIATTGMAGCNLDHYVIKVSGDMSGNGPDEPYSVDVALYNVCPGASFDAPPIANTSCHFELPDSGVYELSCEVPSAFSVPLPQGMFVSVTLSRANAAVAAGAPALRGFSADTFDFPGFPCSGWLGGYPSSPHASFYTKLYMRGDCRESHIGYRNSKNSGSHFSPGQAELFADDVTLGISTCNMVAYEVAYKGNGFLQVDLRRFLSNSDPQNGGLISLETRRTFFSFDPSIKVARAEFAEPIPLPSSFFATFKSNTTAMGPLRTCKDADIGTTGDFYMVIENNQWASREFSSACWAGFDLTIICEGAPPEGACCDMVFVDETGDAVCRDNLSELNCPFPTFWDENGVCESTCDGGVNVGQACTRQQDCPGGSCPGPFPKPCGVSACCKPVTGECENLNRPECNAIEPLPDPRLFQRGTYCNEGGQRCPRPACMRREGECTLARMAHCDGGNNDGQICDVNGIPILECPRWECIDGSMDGQECEPGVTVCIDGSCDPRAAECVGEVGCEDPFCCSDVCAVMPFCCNTHWDELCAAEAFTRCQRTPANDVCFSTSRGEGALLVDVPSSNEGDGGSATISGSDPGFCCHATDPGAGGYGTLWYKFVAPPNGACDGGDRNQQFCDPNAVDPENAIDGCPSGTCLAVPTSVQLSTCCSFFPADDTLLQAFAISEPDRGLCVDRSLCSVLAQDCGDGSLCLLDEQNACQHLSPIGCSDDEDTCRCGPGFPTQRSSVCLSRLTPGDTYYVMVAAKDQANQGKYELRVTTPCNADPAHPLDLCTDAMPLEGGDVEPLIVPFDISGGLEYETATFDCPGEILVPTMENDIWYDWTAPCSGMARAETCGGSDATTPNTNMCVYEGCDCPVDVGTPLDCDFAPPSPCFLGSILRFPVEEGQCYKLRLGGHLGAGPTGNVTIQMDGECLLGCEVGLVEFVDPPNGVVDARQPHPPADGNDLQGIRSFNVLAPLGSEKTECWSFCESDDGGSPNAIVGITNIGAGYFKIDLARPITTGAVTTLTHTDDLGFSQAGVFTSHPGNADGDTASGPPDILKIIDYLNGVSTPPWGIYSEDIDHSDSLQPPDILRVIDLLNGAGSYDPWLNVSLPGCGVCCP